MKVNPVSKRLQNNRATWFQHVILGISKDNDNEDGVSGNVGGGDDIYGDADGDRKI